MIQACTTQVLQAIRAGRGECEPVTASVPRPAPLTLPDPLARWPRGTLASFPLKPFLTSSHQQAPLAPVPAQPLSLPGWWSRPSLECVCMSSVRL